VAKYGDE
jgi:hypothetical protein